MEKIKSKNTCGNCKWFVVDDEAPAQGGCHLEPPKLIVLDVDGGGQEAYWEHPQVGIDNRSCSCAIAGTVPAFKMGE